MNDKERAIEDHIAAKRLLQAMTAELENQAQIVADTQKEVMSHMRHAEVVIHDSVDGKTYRVERRPKRYLRRSLDRQAVADDYESMPPGVRVLITPTYQGTISHLEGEVGKARASDYITEPPARDEITLKTLDQSEQGDTVDPVSFLDT